MKERMEEIKEWRQQDTYEPWSALSEADVNIDWLISELEKTRAENERLKEALEFYADPETYRSHELTWRADDKRHSTSIMGPAINQDRGRWARKAIGRE
jgi:hypothetical protein